MTKKYINTEIPIPGEVMKEYFKDNNIVFLVNYDNSSLKGEKFFDYITNLNLPVEIVSNSSYNEFRDVLFNYMTYPTMIYSEVLRDYSGAILLSYLGVEKDNLPYSFKTPYEYFTRYIEENKDLLDLWVSFLDSTEVFIYASNNEISKDFIKDGDYEVIDDEDIISPNIANLYLSESFIISYTDIDRDRVSKYYIHQAHRNMFSNKPIISFIDKPYNPISIINKQLLGGYMLFSDYTGNDLDEHTKDIKRKALDILDKIYPEPDKEINLKKISDILNSI